MKHPFIHLLVAVSLSLGMTNIATANTPSVTSSADGILAQVNDEIILKSEFIAASQAMAREYRDRGIALSRAEIQNLAMNALITRKLQLGLVNRAGFHPDENLINRELLAIANKEGFNNLADFQRALDEQKAGSYNELRHRKCQPCGIMAGSGSPTHQHQQTRS